MKGKGMIVLCLFCLTAGICVYRPVVKAVTVMSVPMLNGTKIVIDAGHGGNDPGARVSGQDEDEINLDLALRLKTILEKAGAEVVLTRAEDVDLSDNESNIKRSDMKHRAEIMNQSDVTLFVSVHCNTSSDQRCSGSQVYYRKDDAQSRKLADCIQNELKEITQSRYIPASADFYLLNETNVLGVLVEVGFLTNQDDLKKLQSKKHREEVAYGIYLGIHDFLRILY